MMYETIKRLFDAEKLSLEGLALAQKKGWITQEQATLIATGCNTVTQK